MKKIIILIMIIVSGYIFIACDKSATTQGSTTTEATTTETLSDIEKILNYMLDNGGFRVGIMGIDEKGYRIVTSNNSGCEFEYDLYPSGQVYLRLFKTLSNEVVAKVEVYISFVLSETNTEEVKFKVEVYPLGRGMYDADDESVMVTSNVFDTIDINYDNFPSTDTPYLEPVNVYAEILWNEYLRINNEAINQ